MKFWRLDVILDTSIASSCVVEPILDLILLVPSKQIHICNKA